METLLGFVLAALIYFIYVLSWANCVWFKQDLDEQKQRHDKQKQRHEERMKTWDSIIDWYKKRLNESQPESS